MNIFSRTWNLNFLFFFQIKLCWWKRMLQKITKHLLIGMFSKQNIWCLLSSDQNCSLLKNYQSWMGTQSGGLKAMPQKLSYTMHNLALWVLLAWAPCGTMSWAKELVKAKGIQLYRGINSSLPAKALGIQMQENQTSLHSGFNLWPVEKALIAQMDWSNKY